MCRNDKNLTVIKGDVLNVQDCQRAVQGADALVVRYIYLQCCRLDALVHSLTTFTVCYVVLKYSLGGRGANDASVCSEGQVIIDQAVNAANPDMRVVCVTSLGYIMQIIHVFLSLLLTLIFCAISNEISNDMKTK